MSAASDFRALLAAHSPLTAVVSTRIALNSVPEGATYPLVVFTTTEASEVGLSGVVHGTQVTHSVQCWADTGLKAQALAALVRAAIAGDPEYAVLTQADVFDEDLEKDGVELTADRWYT